MKSLTSQEIRKRFLKFFECHGHKVLPGSSLIPADPSLLVTTAGMVQFVPYFKGELKPEHTRIATVQRCMRTTDIENVGHTARHLTFFEMLGNFSIGDYFKAEAIPWAWEFVTKDLKMDPAKLWISIFTEDNEAFRIWTEEVGIPAERIIRLGEDENFWTMGPTGPCGPSSEILYDFGEGMSCGPDCAPGCDCNRFLEIWNLVFTEFDRQEDGRLEPLPRRNIDTGAGLERIAAILQGVTTVFDTDVLRPVIGAVEEVSGHTYGKDKIRDVSMKIIADHARSVTFMANDGILPSNEGRGYVLRRLLRRAVRHGRLLGIDKPFLRAIVERVIDVTSPAYPDVAENAAFVHEIVASEEERFEITLRQGLAMIESYTVEAKGQGRTSLAGTEVFKLYDTYGFPIELTREIAAENGLQLDEPGVEELMERQRRTAREALGERGMESAEVYAEVLDRYGATAFAGYAQDEAVSRVQAVVEGERIVGEADPGTRVDVVLAETPFYAEMGGQVGDTGWIETPEGRVDVEGTFSPVPGLIVHRAVVTGGTLRHDTEIRAVIDRERRNAIKRDHTGTHLLHWALREVLGDHVRQAGSLVDEHRLRFDFTHGKGLKAQELAHLEELVNRKIVENEPVKAYTTTFKFAVESGAIAFFGEKYGAYVRVLEIGDFSRELCGGTHIARTGDIGQLKIVSESSVGANIRRIEAVTGLNALFYAKDLEQTIRGIEKTLKVGRDRIVERLGHIQAAAKEKDRELAALRAKMSSAEVKDLVGGAEMMGETKLIAAVVPGKRMDELRIMADEIKNQVASAAVVLGSSADGGASVLVALTDDVVARDVRALDVVRSIGPIISGGGGGRPDLAQAGGRNTDGVPEAVDAAKELLKGRLA